MKVYIKRTLRNFFSGFSGWAILAGFLFFEGLNFVLINLMYGVTSMQETLLQMQPVLLLLLPALAARCFVGRSPAERRWLASLPTTTTQRLLGEYLGSLFVLLLCSSPLLLFPLLLSVYAEGMALGAAYLTVLGHLLMNAALLAVLFLLSRFFVRRILLALTGTVLLLLLYVVDMLSAILSPAPLASFLIFLGIWGILGALEGILCRRLPFLPIGGAAGTVLCYLLAPELFSYLVPHALAGADVFGRSGGFSGGRLDLAGILFYLVYIAAFAAIAILAEQTLRRTSEGRELV